MVAVRLDFEQIQHPIADSRLDMLDCESHDFEGSIHSLCKSNAADRVVPWCTFHNLRRHGPSASHLWPVRRKRFVYVASSVQVDGEVGCMQTALINHVQRLMVWTIEMIFEMNKAEAEA